MVVANLKEHGLSERQACRVIDLSRCATRYVEQERHPALVERIRQLARENPRYGYRRIWAVLRQEGVFVNRKTVHRICQRLGLQINRIRPKKKRLQSAMYPHQAMYPNHVWTMDFVHDRMANNNSLRMLTLVDEYTRECLDIPVKRSMKATDVQMALKGVIADRGHSPVYIRSDNGSEFIAQALQTWLGQAGIASTFIEPGSPWQNGKCESFNGKFRDECLNMHVFHTLFEAKAIVRQWRKHYNERRPHSALNYLTPQEYASKLPKALRAPSMGETPTISRQGALSAF